MIVDRFRRMAEELGDFLSGNIIRNLATKSVQLECVKLLQGTYILDADDRE